MSAEPSSSIPVENKDKKDVEMEEIVNECSVCKGEIVDETTLDACIHTFCFGCICEWCRKGPGPTCPMCKAVIHKLTHKLESATPAVVDISEVRPEAPVVVVEQADVATERRVIASKCRQLRRRMSVLDQKIEHMTGRHPNSGKSIDDLKDMKQNTVSQLNSLMMLREEIRNGSLKQFINSRVEFRRLIYSEKLRMEAPAAVRKTATVINNLAEQLRAPVIGFILNELKAIPAGVESERNGVFTSVSDTLNGNDQEAAERIFQVMTVIDSEMDRMRFGRKILEIVPIPREYLDVFARELMGFVNSDKSFMMFCGTVTYSLPNEARYQNNSGEDVVTLSDGDDDLPVELGNNDRRSRFWSEWWNNQASYWSRHRETLINLFPNTSEPTFFNLRGRERLAPVQTTHNMISPRVSFAASSYPFGTVPVMRSIQTNSESNFLRDRTSSDSDGDSNLYQRLALRLNPQPQAVDRPPVVAPPFDPVQSWQDLFVGGQTPPRPPNPVPSSSSSGSVAENDDIVVLSDNATSTGNRDDDTIVLDDTVMEVSSDQPPRSRLGPSYKLLRALESKRAKDNQTAAAEDESRKTRTEKKLAMERMMMSRRRKSSRTRERKKSEVEIPDGLMEDIKKIAESYELKGSSGAKVLQAAIDKLEEERKQAKLNELLSKEATTLGLSADETAAEEGPSSSKRKKNSSPPELIRFHSTRSREKRKL